MPQHWHKTKPNPAATAELQLNATTATSQDTLQYVISLSNDASSMHRYPLPSALESYQFLSASFGLQVLSKGQKWSSLAVAEKESEEAVAQAVADSSAPILPELAAAVEDAGEESAAVNKEGELELAVEAPGVELEVQVDADPESVAFPEIDVADPESVTAPERALVEDVLLADPVADTPEELLEAFVLEVAEALLELLDDASLK
ncbi:hypothetical protein F5879DRAFT_994070 [Lentinula edodes]|nr:hypothetical protein F5879DRAFT_994070 [Lentinula edodes]